MDCGTFRQDAARGSLWPWRPLVARTRYAQRCWRRSGTHDPFLRTLKACGVDESVRAALPGVALATEGMLTTPRWCGIAGLGHGCRRVGAPVCPSRQLIARQGLFEPSELVSLAEVLHARLAASLDGLQQARPGLALILEQLC